MVKGGLRILVGILMMFILTACPYQSNVPVTPPNETLNEDLFGEWISTSDLEFTYPTYYKVTEQNETKYKVVENRFNSTDSVYKEVIYFMHTSTIKDKMFVNLIAANGKKYYIYLLNLQKSELTLTGVTENIDEQFSTSKELEKFIKKHMDLSFFYAKSDEKYLKRTE